jgi:hypothetical protein
VTKLRGARERIREASLTRDGRYPAACIPDHSARHHLQWNPSRVVRRSHAGGDRWRRIAGAAAAAESGSGYCVGGAYVGSIVTTLAVLHPLEYVAMKPLAGGTRGAYDRFELDYWSVAATEALRRLEHRLDYDTSLRFAESPPSILICIPWREHNVAPMLQRPWIVETDPDKADFIIATEPSPCAEDKPVELIDEVKGLNRTFAWVYARRAITADR